MTSILAFFILICVLVFVHEYGHFWAARKCGVKVIRFSIGFGKVLFRRTDKYGTEFAFSLIPLGGYVQMWNGESAVVASADQALNQKSVLQRIFIVLAGPVANFLFAIVAYWAIFVIGVPTVKPVIGQVLPNSISAQAKLVPELQIQRVAGQNVRDWEEVSLALVANVGNKSVELEGTLIDENRPQRFQLDLSQWDIDGTKRSPLTSLGIRPQAGRIEPKVAKVVENSPAQKAGINEGDLILAINDQPFDWQYLLDVVKEGKAFPLTVQQQTAKKTLLLTPEKSEKTGQYLIGIAPTYQPLAEKYRTEIKYGAFEAIGKSIEKVGALIKTILQFVGNLLTGDLSLKNMGGPISMAKGAGATAEIGWVYYLSFMALISVNLGVMNLFPILPLDGGRLLLLSGEGILRKPLPEKVEMRFQQFGIMFVLGLMIFAFINDIIHF